MAGFYNPSITFNHIIGGCWINMLGSMSIVDRYDDALHNCISRVSALPKLAREAAWAEHQQSGLPHFPSSCCRCYCQLTFADVAQEPVLAAKTSHYPTASMEPDEHRPSAIGHTAFWREHT